MFLNSTDLETFANVLEHVDVTSRTNDGVFLTTTGRHPVLGPVVMVQDPFKTVILSETEITDEALVDLPSFV